MLGAPILFAMVIWPGQGWFEYFIRAEPVTFLLAAAFLAGAVVYGSTDPSADKLKARDQEGSP